MFCNVCDINILSSLHNTLFYITKFPCAFQYCKRSCLKSGYIFLTNLPLIDALELLSQHLEIDPLQFDFCLSLLT